MCKSSPSDAPRFLSRTRPPCDSRLAKGEIEGQSPFARFLVFRAHVAASLGHRGNRGVEIDPVPGFDLVDRDHEGDPGFYRAEGAPLDAWHLHVTGDRVAGHAQVVFEGRLRG